MLQGTRWCLLSIVLDGHLIDGVADADAYMVLGLDNRATGRGGCNRFFGSYRLEGADLRFGPMASTMMYCERTMAVERAFFQALERIRTARVENGVLEMRSEDGSTVLSFRAGAEA